MHKVLQEVNSRNRTSKCKPWPSVSGLPWKSSHRPVRHASTITGSQGYSCPSFRANVSAFLCFGHFSKIAQNFSKKKNVINSFKDVFLIYTYIHMFMKVKNIVQFHPSYGGMLLDSFDILSA